MARVFDKMVVGINKGINAVGESSKLMIEKAQLNTVLQDAEKERRRIYMEMGELVYNLHKKGEIYIENCQVMCDEIKNVNKRIVELHIQLKDLESQKQSLLSLESNTVYESGEDIVCACGYRNRGTSKFCAKCGKQISI